MKKQILIATLFIFLFILGVVIASPFDFLDKREVKTIVKFENKSLEEALDLKIIDWLEPVDSIKFKSNIDCFPIDSNACKDSKCFINSEGCGDNGDSLTFEKDNEVLINVVKRNCELVDEDKDSFLLIFPIYTDGYYCKGYDGDYGVTIQ